MEKCLICGSSFKSKRSLANHIRTHQMTPSKYKDLFRDELTSGLIEGKDYVECPICHKRLSLLRRHLKYAHNLSYTEINELDCQLRSDNAHSKISESIKESWEAKDRVAIGSKISATKSAKWTPEDTKRLYEARVAKGVYSEIGKKRNQRLIEKFDTYEEYLQFISDHLPEGDHGKRIYSEDSFGPVVYRSAYEYKLSRILNDLDVDYKYEPFWIEYFDPDRQKFRKYNPDFYIESLNLVLEVKPIIFLENEVVQSKMKAVLAAGYKFEFVHEGMLNRYSIEQIMI